MSQMYARLYVKVTEPSVWKKLFKLNLERYGLLCSAEELFGEALATNSTELLLNDECSASFNEIYSLVNNIRNKAGSKCVVFADWTDINVDCFTHYFAYINEFYDREVDGDVFPAQINDVEKWLKKARIRRTESVLKYLSKFDGENFAFAKKQYEQLKTKAAEPKKATAIVSSAMKGLRFAVTGDLGHFPDRSKLKEYIESCGGKLTGSVSSKTNYLITDHPDSGTTKIQAALELGVKIISEEEFLKMFGEPT